MEEIMNLRSLIPFRGSSSPMRPEMNVFGTLHREIDRLFDDLTRGFGATGMQAMSNLVPSIDASETDKEIVITAELPGLERKDVEVSLDDNILTIRGEKKIEAEQKDDKSKNVHVSERAYGLFYRMLELPTGIDPSTVQATMSKGVLKVTIPKPTRSEAKKIEVKEAA
jgi:HSP20 family protein